jgi:hypothetical protein
MTEGQAAAHRAHGKEQPEAQQHEQDRQKPAAFALRTLGD